MPIGTVSAIDYHAALLVAHADRAAGPGLPACADAGGLLVRRRTGLIAFGLGLAVALLAFAGAHRRAARHSLIAARSAMTGLASKRRSARTDAFERALRRPSNATVPRSPDHVDDDRHVWRPLRPGRRDMIVQPIGDRLISRLRDDDTVAAPRRSPVRVCLAPVRQLDLGALIQIGRTPAGRARRTDFASTAMTVYVYRFGRLLPPPRAPERPAPDLAGCGRRAALAEARHNGPSAIRAYLRRNASQVRGSQQTCARRGARAGKRADPALVSAPDIHRHRRDHRVRGTGALAASRTRPDAARRIPARDRSRPAC